MKTDQPGLSFFTPGTPGAVGFEPALADELLQQDLGYDVQQIMLTAGNWEDELSKKSVDVVFSSISVTPERRKHFIFAGPYLLSPLGALTLRSSRIPDQQERTLHGLKVCYLKDTTAEQTIDTARTADPTIRAVAVDQDAECLTALNNGSADIYVSDAAILLGRLFASSDSSPYQFTDERLMASGEVQAYGIALRPDDQALCARIAQALQGEINADATKWNDYFRQHVANGQLAFNQIEVYRPTSIHQDWCRPPSSQS